MIEGYLQEACIIEPAKRVSLFYIVVVIADERNIAQPHDLYPERSFSYKFFELCPGNVEHYVFIAINIEYVAFNIIRCNPGPQQPGNLFYCCLTEREVFSLLNKFNDLAGTIDPVGEGEWPAEFVAQACTFQFMFESQWQYAIIGRDKEKAILLCQQHPGCIAGKYVYRNDVYSAFWKMPVGGQQQVGRLLEVVLRHIMRNVDHWSAGCISHKNSLCNGDRGIARTQIGQ